MNRINRLIVWFEEDRINYSIDELIVYNNINF